MTDTATLHADLDDIIAAQAAARSEAEQIDNEYRAIAENFVWYKGLYGPDEDGVLPHQWQGVTFGAEAQRWICGDGMGLGKTREAIGWMDLVDARRVVIVCEAGVAQQFADETAEYAPHRKVFTLAKRGPAARGEIMRQVVKSRDAVLVVNFEIWRRDQPLLEQMMLWQPDTVIVDEAHNLKSTKSGAYANVGALIGLNVDGTKHGHAENVCLGCGGAMLGYLRKPAGSTRYVDVPCPACGWTARKAELRLPTTFVEWQERRSVKNLLLMSGTPILNSPVDLYALLHMVDPIQFESQAAFLRVYTQTNYAGKPEFTTVGSQLLRQRISHCFLARKREDAGIKLPKQHPHTLTLTLDKREYPRQYRTIRQITEAAQIVLDSGENATLMHLISVIMRKRQANVWPGGIQIREPGTGRVLVDVGKEVRESIKLDYLVDNVLIKHEEGHRQVVFSQFKTALIELEARLRSEGLRVARLDGDTPEGKRKAIKRDFYRPEGEPKYDVLLANYKTGGTGLNIIQASVVHELDDEWNPGKRGQARGRVDRIGQTRETYVYRYHIKGTVDTWMADIMRRKERLLDQFESAKLTDVVTPQGFLAAMKSGELL